MQERELLCEFLLCSRVYLIKPLDILRTPYIGKNWFLKGILKIGTIMFTLVSRMSKGSESTTTSRPLDRSVIIPEAYSGEQPWEDWINQFESIAAINS